MRTSLSRSRERGREKRGIYESRRKTIENNELLNASFAATLQLENAIGTMMMRVFEDKCLYPWSFALERVLFGD